MKKFLTLVLILGLLGSASASALSIKSISNNCNSTQSNTCTSSKSETTTPTENGSKISIPGCTLDTSCITAQSNSNASCNTGNCNVNASCITGQCNSNASCNTGNCNVNASCITGQCNSNVSCNTGNCNVNASSKCEAAQPAKDTSKAASQPENTTVSQDTSNASVKAETASSQDTSKTCDSKSNSQCPYSYIISASGSNNQCPYTQNVLSILQSNKCPYSQNENSSQEQSSQVTNANSSQVQSSPVSTGSSSVSKLANEVLVLVNKERTSRGLNALTLNINVQATAQTRAKEIVTSFSHTRPDGTSCFTALKENGVSYRGAGENIAMGQTSAEQVMNSWMNSSGHRANILNANYTQIGIGVYQDSAGRYYWTQMFIY